MTLLDDGGPPVAPGSPSTDRRGLAVAAGIGLAAGAVMHARHRRRLIG